jgi:hypothetical protein
MVQNAKIIKLLESARQANRLLVKIILFNLGLYVLIVQLIRQDILPGDSVFPPLVLFLSFAFSIGILLIVGLGEQVDPENVKNEWVKKIGVTPIMGIVAALISILASFSPLANLILPTNLTFMVAKMGLTCEAADKSVTPEATELLTLIYSMDGSYIKKLDDFLRGRPDNYIDQAKLLFSKLFTGEPATKFPTIRLVEQSDKDDAYNLLTKFADRGSVRIGRAFESAGKQD